MKYVMAILSIFVLISCSSSENKKKQAWDDGAQKQEDYQVEQQQETQERIRNQFPGPSSF